MTNRRPLVRIDGKTKALPVGDKLPPDIIDGGILGVPLYAEPVVVAGFNEDAVYHTGASLIPLFVTTTDGDIITAGVL